MDITIHNLTKRFGKVTALDHVSLTIGPGMFGLLGPNGAGKTTLMRVLATLLEPDQGAVSFGAVDLREDPQAVRRMIGYLPQEVGFYRQLTGPEYLELVAGMKGIPGSAAREQVESVLRVVNLGEHQRKRIGQYSGGMKRRLGIAQALLGEPQVLIVDEPTVGLDPEERLRFRNLLADISGSRTVLLSTHIVSDVETACEHLAVMDKGRLLFAGATADLIAQAQSRVWALQVSAADYERLRQSLHIVSTRRLPDGMALRVISQENPLGEGVPADPTLEDGYLCLTGAAGEVRA